MNDPQLDGTIPTSPASQDGEELPDSTNNVDETKPTALNEDDETKPAFIATEDRIESKIDMNQDPGEPQKERSRTPLIVLAGILGLVIAAVLSAWIGYNSGVDLRTEAEATQVAKDIENQFILGVQDMQDGEYYRARQRFEYVIQQDPDYPGATDKLTEVLLLLNATATPSPVPTATLTPTADLRGVQEAEDLFNEGEQLLLNEDWSGAIEKLLQLRKMDPSHRMVAVDGMLFIALRNRGIQKIGQQGDLEGGMYDLAVAERFGPLDSEAQGYLTWAKLYVTGASFWELDWGQAVFYFSQVAEAYPGLRDGSGWTARDRYRLALIGLADTMMAAKDPCQAAETYQLALFIAPDPQAEEALVLAVRQCEGGKRKDDPDDETAPPPEDELPLPTSEPGPYPQP